ncbi:MAG: DUF2085 domain-containing protein [Anaerolineales bacterium]|nr:DUF2085 domain-containing protein [Anaerolineales bacterium]
MSDVSLESLPPAAHPPTQRYLPYLVGGVAAVAVVSWLLNTPEGILGKAGAIGYAICHRIDSHSLHIGNAQFPLCARCTGIYLGVLLGMVTLLALGRRRAGGMPRAPIFVALLAFIGLMGVDGVNSYLNFFPGLPRLYEPNNSLRVITGLLNGLALAGLMVPVFNQTLWADWEDRPVLGRWRELALLVGLAAIIAGLIFTDQVIFLYPLALLSVVGVLAILVALNTTILLIALKQENKARTPASAALPLLAGFTLAMLEIGAIDWLRYSVFHTWSGLPGLN